MSLFDDDDRARRVAAFEAMDHTELAQLAAEAAAGIRHLRALVLGGRQAPGELEGPDDGDPPNWWWEDGTDVEAAVYYLISGLPEEDQGALMEVFARRYRWDAEYVARIMLDWCAMAQLRDVVDR